MAESDMNALLRGRDDLEWFLVVLKPFSTRVGSRFHGAKKNFR
jgi:hypothetical protein